MSRSRLLLTAWGRSMRNRDQLKTSLLFTKSYCLKSFASRAKVAVYAGRLDIMSPTSQRIRSTTQYFRSYPRLRVLRFATELYGHLGSECIRVCGLVAGTRRGFC